MPVPENIAHCTRARTEGDVSQLEQILNAANSRKYDIAGKGGYHEAGALL